MRPILPKEHGSWAVLAAPIAVGLSAARGGSAAASALFCAAALGGFLLRAPLQATVSGRPEPGVRESLALYSLLALAGAAPLLFAYGRVALAAFALPAACLLAADLLANKGKRSFSWAAEIGGVLVLCLGAPAAFYAARGTLGADAWAAWLTSALFFSGPIFHVKAAALQHRAAGDASLAGALARARRLSVAYHAAALAVVLTLAARHAVPSAALLPFLAALAKTLLRAARPPERVDFRRLGYQEVGYSVFFAAALAAGYIS